MKIKNKVNTKNNTCKCAIIFSIESLTNQSSKCEVDLKNILFWVFFKFPSFSVFKGDAWFLLKPSHSSFGNFFPTGTYAGISTCVEFENVKKSAMKKKSLVLNWPVNKPVNPEAR